MRSKFNVPRTDLVLVYNFICEKLTDSKYFTLKKKNKGDVFIKIKEMCLRQRKESTLTFKMISYK